MAVKQIQEACTIKILDAKSTLPEANEIAKSQNTRLPTLSEFIIALRSSSKLFKEAEGEGLFYWLADTELPKSSYGHCIINYGKGTLSHVTDVEASSLSPIDSAYVSNRTSPLTLNIDHNSLTKVCSLYVVGGHEPGFTAQIAVLDASQMLLEGSVALKRLRRNLQSQAR